MAFSESERKKKFFYATELNAGMYDATVDFVVPQYKNMHDVMIDLMDRSFRQVAQTSMSSCSTVALEIGSGTGALSIPLLGKFPLSKLVAVDFSPPMNILFRKSFAAAFPSEDIDSRVRFVEADILGEHGRPESLRSVLAEFTNGLNSSFDAVVTALTLHHFERAEKMEVYTRMFRVLKSQGLLLNGDLFSYESRHLTDFAKNFDVTWIKEKFEARAVAVESAGESKDLDSKTASDWRRLGSLWQKHYEEDNLLDSTEIQELMLRFTGFRHTGVPFRFWEGGILWGQK